MSTTATARTRSIYGDKAEHVNYERTNALIAQQKTEEFKLQYYKEQANLAKTTATLMKADALLSERESNVRSMIEWAKKDVLKAQIETEQTKQAMAVEERTEAAITANTLQALNISLQSKAISEHASNIASRVEASSIAAETLNLIKGQTSSANAMFSKIKEETVILKAQALEATADNTARLKTEAGKLTSEAARQAYYKAETKRAEALTLKVEAEAKILVEHTAKEASQGHLYKAGTTLACLGCITGLLALGLYGYKAIQELRG